MTTKYIPSIIYRNYINLFSKLMDLPQTSMFNVNGVAKEHTVFHRMELLDYDSEDECAVPKLSINSYVIKAVNPEEPIPGNYVEINPEFEFTQSAIFWAGAPMKVFKDYMALNDKKFGSLSWCASYERELYYPSFYVVESEPVFTMVITLAMLDKLEVPEVKATKVGSVDEDGTFIPAKPVLNNTQVQKQPNVTTAKVSEEESQIVPSVWSFPRQSSGILHKALDSISSFANPLTA